MPSQIPTDSRVIRWRFWNGLKIYQEFSELDENRDWTCKCRRLSRTIFLHSAHSASDGVMLCGEPVIAAL
jgi:hypothetical protein